MKNNFYIVNTKKFQEKTKNIKQAGLDNLYVLSDFDSTLTYGLLNGKKTPSMIAIIREDNSYLGKDYSKKASSLAQKYFPILSNPRINKKKKNALIEEWYDKHFKLLIDKKLNKKHFKKIISDPKIRFRDKAFQVFSFLNKHKIPLIVISASGLGKEPILMLFKKENKLYPNIEVISNSFIWDKKQNALDYEKPIINSVNKEKALLNNDSCFNKVKNRKNILLLGDTLDDINMASNLKYQNLIKVCFLNKENDQYINDFKKHYDVLILNDSSMDFIDNFLKSL